MKLTPRLRKNLAGAPTLLQGFGGYTRGCASAPPRINTATRREERPISEDQPLRVPNGYHRGGTGATVGGSHKGPLKARAKPIFQKIIKCEQTHKPQITPCEVATRGGEGPTAQITSVAHQAASLGTPRANMRLARGPGATQQNLRLTRGADAPSGKSSPHSRGRRPLGQISASLEGMTPPRAILRFARGRPGTTFRTNITGVVEANPGSSWHAYR
jgi:hypothetical protein